MMSKHSHFEFGLQKGNINNIQISKFRAAENRFSFRRNDKLAIFAFRNVESQNIIRSFHTLRKETNNNAMIQHLSPRSRADLYYVTVKRRNHTKDEEFFTLGWKELLTILGAVLGIYFSFLIWGWNFRYESLREFESTYNTEEAENSQMLLTLFEECARPERPSGISDYEYYNLCCDAIVKKYIELKNTNPAIAKELFSAVHQIFTRYSPYFSFPLHFTLLFYHHFIISPFLYSLKLQLYA